MHRIMFQTTRPLDVLPRALDLLRKMSMELRHACADVVSDQEMLVTITFVSSQEQQMATLFERLRVMQGVNDCRVPALGESKCRG